MKLFVHFRRVISGPCSSRLVSSRQGRTEKAAEAAAAAAAAAMATAPSRGGPSGFVREVSLVRDGYSLSRVYAVCPVPRTWIIWRSMVEGIMQASRADKGRVWILG